MSGRTKNPPRQRNLVDLGRTAGNSASGGEGGLVDGGPEHRLRLGLRLGLRPRPMLRKFRLAWRLEPEEP